MPHPPENKTGNMINCSNKKHQETKKKKKQPLQHKFVIRGI